MSSKHVDVIDQSGRGARPCAAALRRRRDRRPRRPRRADRTPRRVRLERRTPSPDRRSGTEPLSAPAGRPEAPLEIDEESRDDDRGARAWRWRRAPAECRAGRSRRTRRGSRTTAEDAEEAGRRPEGHGGARGLRPAVGERRLQAPARAATCSSTAASSRATRAGSPWTASSCGACGRSSQGTLGRHFEFQIMPDFGGGTTVLQDAWLDVELLAEGPGARRQVQVAGRPRAAAVGDGALVRRARLPDGHRPQPRRRRDAPRRPRGRGPRLCRRPLRRGPRRGQRRRRPRTTARTWRAASSCRRSSGASRALKGLGFGIAGTTGKQSGALPAYRSAGQVSLLTIVSGVTVDGTRNRLSPQLSFYSGPVRRSWPSTRGRSRG